MKSFVYMSHTLFLFLLLAIPRGITAAENAAPNLLKLQRYTVTEKIPPVAPVRPYHVPRAWLLDPAKGEEELAALARSGALTKPVAVASPREAVKQAIARILAYKRKHPAGTPGAELKTGKNVVAMNSLPRVLSMYDHDRDGIIGSKPPGDITLNAGGYREMGTFVKNIMVLPYLKALGYNTIHFQPITEIGVYGRKGDLGSPFAIRDPYQIDTNLADPLFGGTAGEQYQAFIEAAHALNMKVVQEVIPRTVSIDSAILEKNPSFGYWVKEGSPRRMPDYYNAGCEYQTDAGPRRFQDRASFDEWFFNEYKKKIYGGKYTCKDLIDVTKTDPEWTGFFMTPPDVVKREASGKLVGHYYLPGSKEIDPSKRAEVLPAFCDTPFEVQPFWTDVTYLRLYDNTDGTMPMLGPLSFVNAKFFKDVEPAIERKYRYTPVWNMITGYFSYYKSLGADGFVLDMGHALPEELKTGIRKVLPVVWEENLGAGFDYLAKNRAIFTGLVFSYCMPAYSNDTEMKLYQDSPEKAVTFYREHTRKLFSDIAASDTYRGKMFGSPDNYNTKRIGETPATRELSKAPLLEGTAIPDFTRAPVNREKARKLTIMYYTLFKIMAGREHSPFITNTVFGTDFLASSTINVGLSTPLKESKQFYEYMTDNERKANPGAPRLLLLSKPVKLTGEWTNDRHIIREMLTVNRAVKEMAPHLAGITRLEIKDTGNPDILCLYLYEVTGSSDPLVVACNRSLDRNNTFDVKMTRGRFYLNKPSGAVPKGPIRLGPGEVTVFMVPNR